MNSDRDPPPPFVEFFDAEAERIRNAFGSQGAIRPEQWTDLNSTIQRMYDTRKDFVENADRYYTRYFLALAGVLYAIKFALDSDSHSSRCVLLVGAAILCFVLAWLIGKGRTLLGSLYYLYSASAVTAAIKSNACREWAHSWFDQVYLSAEALDEEWKKGQRERRGDIRPLRQQLADRWASQPNNLLSTDSSIHALLQKVLIALGVVAVAACLLPEAWFGGPAGDHPPAGIAGPSSSIAPTVHTASEMVAHLPGPLSAASVLDPAALLWVLVLGSGLVLLVKRPGPGAVLLLLVAGCWWTIEFSGAPARWLASLEKPYADRTDYSGAPANAIVVLGGFGGASDYELSGLDLSQTADRLITGLELARRASAPVLVISGLQDGASVDPLAGHSGVASGDGSLEQLVRRPWSSRLSHWLASFSLTNTTFLELGPCVNTRDEAVRTAGLAAQHGWTNVVLVTSAWHMPRAERAFSAVGLDVIPIGCDFQGTASLDKPTKWIPQTQTLVMLQIWLHEVVGNWYYETKGW